MEDISDLIQSIQQQKADEIENHAEKMAGYNAALERLAYAYLGLSERGAYKITDKSLKKLKLKHMVIGEPVIKWDGSIPYVAAIYVNGHHTDFIQCSIEDIEPMEAE